MVVKPATVERRRGGRLPSQLRVHFGTCSCDRIALAENISETGLYINTNHVYPVGTPLLLQVEFPECSVFRRAQVVWAIRVPEHMRQEMICGMGVEFIGVDGEWQHAYRRWRSGQTS